MLLPSAVFIDTSIFDQYHYNFDSSGFKALSIASYNNRITLLLPYITEVELMRHITLKSEEAYNAILKAQRKAPFLHKWKLWNSVRGRSREIVSGIENAANDEFRNWLKQFDVVRLGTDNVNLTNVINWYVHSSPPFENKKDKKAEFPDAIALSSLLEYADRKNAIVAVISNDVGMKLAADEHSRLMSFSSVSKYIEITSSKIEYVSRVLPLFDPFIARFDASIGEEFCNLSFYSDDNDVVSIDNIIVEEIIYTDLRVVGIGAIGVSLMFTANIKFSFEATVEYINDYNELDIDKLESSNYTSINGIAKVEIDSDWTTIVEVKEIVLDENSIRIDHTCSVIDEE